MTEQDDAGAKPKSSFSAIAAGLMNEFGSNRRATIGVLAIGVLIGGYGLLALIDATDGLRATYGLEMQRLHRVAATEQETNWPERAASSAEVRENLDKRLWSAESEGGALADLQEWVTRTGREVGIDKLQVQVEVAKPKGMPSDIRQVTATINAPQTEDGMIQLLARIASEPHLLVIDRLRVQQRPVPRLEMNLLAYTKLVAGTASGNRANAQ
jgi:hypothetical protein